MRTTELTVSLVLVDLKEVLATFLLTHFVSFFTIVLYSQAVKHYDYTKRTTVYQQGAKTSPAPRQSSNEDRQKIVYLPPCCTGVFELSVYISSRKPQRPVYQV